MDLSNVYQNFINVISATYVDSSDEEEEEVAPAGPNNENA